MNSQNSGELGPLSVVSYELRSFNSAMNETELTRILETIDSGLAVFQDHRGSLSGLEISVKSMLLALRLQVADQLNRARQLVEFTD